jgi:hypothetical protein
MTNDLVIDHDRRRKFVDDTSVSVLLIKVPRKMQSLVNAINSWCIKNDMKLNQSKCKDMIISFEKDRPKLDPIFVNNHEIVPVSSAKFLSTYISAQWRSQGGRAPPHPKRHKNNSLKKAKSVEKFFGGSTRYMLEAETD